MTVPIGNATSTLEQKMNNTGLPFHTRILSDEKGAVALFSSDSEEILALLARCYFISACITARLRPYIKKKQTLFSSGYLAL